MNIERRESARVEALCRRGLPPGYLERRYAEEAKRVAAEEEARARSQAAIVLRLTREQQRLLRDEILAVAASSPAGVLIIPPYNPGVINIDEIVHVGEGCAS